MARKRNVLGITLLVLSIVAWGFFAYFLVKTITSATSAANCFNVDCAGQGAEDAASYTPWLIGTAFGASILLTLAILAFRLRPVQAGPTSWDQVAQMGSAAGAAAAPAGWESQSTIPGYGPAVTQVTPTNFALPGAAPPAFAPQVAGGPQASIVAARPGTATATGMDLQVDMDVTVPGQAPRRVTKQMTVPPGALARLYPGAVFPVTVNPANPDDVTLNLGG